MFYIIKIITFAIKSIIIIMTQLVLEIDSPAMVRTIKSLVNNLSGVNVRTIVKKKKTGIEKAFEDIDTGNIIEYKSVKDLISNAKR